MNEDQKSSLRKAITETEPSLETILDLAASADPQIRAGALRLLAASAQIAANQDVLACMMKGLGDPAWTVGRAAEEALQAIGRPFVKRLVSLLEGSDVGSKILAARALSVMEPGPEDIQLYADSLLTRIIDTEESREVQQFAAVGLVRSVGRVADPNSLISRLKDLQRSPDEGVASAAKYVLERAARPACPPLPRFWELTYRPSELKPDEALHISDCQYCRRVSAMCEEEVQHVPIEAFILAKFSDEMQFHLSGARCNRCVEMMRSAERIRSEVGQDAGVFAGRLEILSNFSARLHSLATWIGLLSGRKNQALVTNLESLRNIFGHRIGAVAVMAREIGEQIPKILLDKTENLRIALSTMGLFPAGYWASQLRGSTSKSRDALHGARIEAWQAADPHSVRIVLENLPTEKETVIGVVIPSSAEEPRAFAAKRVGDLWAANVEDVGTGEILILLEPFGEA